MERRATPRGGGDGCASLKKIAPHPNGKVGRGHSGWSEPWVNFGASMGCLDREDVTPLGYGWMARVSWLGQFVLEKGKRGRIAWC